MLDTSTGNFGFYMGVNVANNLANIDRALLHLLRSKSRGYEHQNI